MDKTQSAPERQWAKDLGPGEDVRSLFLINAASQQQARNGPFWRLEIKDASASLEARVWSPLSQQYAEIPTASIVWVEGRAESFRDKIQVNVSKLHILSAEEASAVDTSVFLPSSSRPPLEMLDELETLCRRELTYKPWRTFALAVLGDPEIRPRLLQAQAAKSVHHAWVGGLLEHTLSVVMLCLRFCEQYPSLDKQVLLVGALCHDMGKVWELSSGLVNDYTDEGRLLGHMYLGLEKVERHLRKSGLSEELVLHFKHLILSHHGQYEYTSPRLPQTAEAFALHYADNLDAKLTQCRSLFDNAQEEETGWSSYQRTLERQIFQPPRTPDAPPRKRHSPKTEEEKNLEVIKAEQCSLL